MTEIEKLTSDSDTRQRILDAAEVVFADKGREAASVREILRLAGVKNIAAINYHYGDKDRLYIEVVKHAHQSCCFQTFPNWPDGIPAKVRLRDFIRTVVERMLQPARPTALRLMMREMAQPTEACAEVVRNYIQPMAEILERILADLRPDLPRPQRFLVANSIVSQCLFYRQNKPIIELLMGPEMFGALNAELLTEHITQFTLRALGIAQEPRP
ncbi:MAG: CerR family C-terminal domain-containing protein, partial [Gemmataceae bacterium]